VTGFTQWAFLAFGRGVLNLLFVFRFSLCERKNENREKEKYHAAAGTAVSEYVTA
jgi:hypothetical protein